jgi:hypothetical protein
LARRRRQRLQLARHQLGNTQVWRSFVQAYEIPQE